KGRSIQAKGITPDIIVEDPFNPSDQSTRLREADLGRHLENDKGTTEKPAPKPEAKAPQAPQASTPRPKPKPLEPGEIVSKEDFQVNQALNHLKGLPVLAKAPQN
ncbi:MAG: peptidase S41, partial [Burkholderiales bacterium]|nr:peptidase S41 [Burkholderiales bacterium]